MKVIAFQKSDHEAIIVHASLFKSRSCMWCCRHGRQVAAAVSIYLEQPGLFYF